MAAKGKETRAVTEQEYREIIQVMREGRPGFFKPNHRAAMALVLEANTGLRISDIVKLRLRDIIRDGGKWRYSIVEQKTGKERIFTVPDDLRQFIVEWCYRNGVKDSEPIVGIQRRSVQDALKKVCDYLELERVGTHSFRKYFSRRIYDNSGRDIDLVRELLQHSSLAITQRYLRTTPEKVESALKDNMVLM